LVSYLEEGREMAKIGVVVVVLSLVLVLSIHSVLAEDQGLVQTAADHVTNAASTVVKNAADNLSNHVGEAVEKVKETTTFWAKCFDWFHGVIK
jgi:predicted metalloprotease